MKHFWTGVVGLGLVLGPWVRVAGGSGGAGGGQEVNVAQLDGKSLMAMVASRENEATTHRGRYMYLSVERSDRTGGHEWTERVAETAWGKVRYLVAEDGKPLTADRLASERTRIEDEGKNPEIFKQEEAGKMEDEQHARLPQLVHAFSRQLHQHIAIFQRRDNTFRFQHLHQLADIARRS